MIGRDRTLVLSPAEKFLTTDNDSYMLQYRGPTGPFHDWYTAPVDGGGGLRTRPGGWDRSQRQALPPVTAAGLTGLGWFVRKRR